MTASIIRTVYLPDRVEQRGRPKGFIDVPQHPTRGYAMMHGRDSEGRIRVYARNLVKQLFIQVGAYDRYDLADLYVKQLCEDDSFRRAEVKLAKELKPFKP